MSEMSARKDWIIESLKRHFGGDIMARRDLHENGLDSELLEEMLGEHDLAAVGIGAELSDLVALSWSMGYWLAQVPLYGMMGWAAGLARLGAAGPRKLAADIFEVASAGGPVVQLVGGCGAALHRAGRPIACGLVPYAAAARMFLVARQSGETVSVHAVPAKGAGVRVEAVSTMFPNASADVMMTSSAIDESKMIGVVSVDEFNCAAMVVDLLRSAYLGGAMHACLDIAVTYVKERRQFGKPLGTIQVVQHALADVDTEVNAVRRVLHHAQSLRLTSGNAAYAYSIAGILARDGGACASATCMHLLGGKGFLRNGPIEKYYRAAKQLQLEQGGGERERESLSSVLA